MFYPNKPFSKNLLVATLFLLPLTSAVSDDLPKQVARLQSQLLETNAKIVMLETDQHKTAMQVNTLQTDMNAVDQQIDGIKNEHVQLSGVVSNIRRTANGHGR